MQGAEDAPIARKTRSRSHALFAMLLALAHTDMKLEGPGDMPVFPQGAMWRTPEFTSDHDEGEDLEDEDEGHEGIQNEGVKGADDADDAWLALPPFPTPLDALASPSTTTLVWTGHAFRLHPTHSHIALQGSAPSITFHPYAPATAVDPAMLLLRGAGVDEYGARFSLGGRYWRAGVVEPRARVRRGGGRGGDAGRAHVARGGRGLRRARADGRARGGGRSAWCRGMLDKGKNKA